MAAHFLGSVTWVEYDTEEKKKKTSKTSVNMYSGISTRQSVGQLLKDSALFV